MLTRLKADFLLQRCILPSIASNFHAAATLFESSGERAKADQKSRLTRRPKAPRDDSKPVASQRRPRDSRDQRLGKPASSGGGRGGGGGYGQQGGQSKGWGPRRPQQEGGVGETNLLKAVLEGTESAGIQVRINENNSKGALAFGRKHVFKL